jgi:hypothetical protein
MEEMMSELTDLRYEIRNLQWKLRDARETIARLETLLRDEKDSHHSTSAQLKEYKERSSRAYDAYVTSNHEGYIPQEDVDDLYELMDEHDAMNIWVIEMRVQPTIFESHRHLFLEREKEWQQVDHNRRPSNIAHLSELSVNDLPDIDPGWEARARHVLSSRVLCQKVEPLPVEIIIPDTDLPWDIYEVTRPE